MDWNTLSRPYNYGGWNIKNMEWFGMVLRLKILWLALKGLGIRSSMIRPKYLKKYILGLVEKEKVLC